MIVFEPMKKCPICGRSFIPTVNWLYKLSKNKRVQYYCRYNCYREAGGGKGKYKIKTR